MSGSGSAPGDPVGPSVLRQPEAQSSSLPKDGFFLISPELRAAGDPSLEGAGHMVHATGRGQQEVPQEARGRRRGLTATSSWEQQGHALRVTDPMLSIVRRGSSPASRVQNPVWVEQASTVTHGHAPSAQVRQVSPGFGLQKAEERALGWACTPRLTMGPGTPIPPASPECDAHFQASFLRRPGGQEGGREAGWGLTWSGLLRGESAHICTCVCTDPTHGGTETPSSHVL